MRACVREYMRVCMAVYAIEFMWRSEDTIGVFLFLDRLLLNIELP